MKIYSFIHENRFPFAASVGCVADELKLTPAESATLTAKGAVVLHDVLYEPLLVQLEAEPEEYTAVESISIDDYGNVSRWWCNGLASGEAQL